MKYPFATLVTCALALTATAAHAQEHGPVGLTIAYPSSIGMVWHISDRFAVRPRISFSRSTTESATSLVIQSPPINTVIATTTTTRGWTLGSGVSALIYLAKWDALQLYVSPSIGYRRTTSTTTSDSAGFSPLVPTPPQSRTTKSTSDGYDASGTLGVQFALHRRLAVIAETGLLYATSSSNPQTSSLPGLASSTFDSRVFGTTAGVGVVFYF